MTHHRPPRPVPRWQLLASGVGLILLAIVVLFLAYGCAGDSPTAATSDYQSVQTAYGEVSVYGPIAAADVRTYIESGYDRVSAVYSGLDAEGSTVVVTGGPAEDRGYYGAYHSGQDTIEVVDGHPSVIDHEVQHRAACYQLGRTGECCELVDHPGGFDLRCRRLSE